MAFRKALRVVYSLPIKAAVIIVCDCTKPIDKVGNISSFLIRRHTFQHNRFHFLNTILFRIRFMSED